ncbi:MAG TPA: hypothetical protein VN461_18835 [Vicinamibacteria bacterium]|jgi:hypothetical protein|nr:hypothetical protein [Vicinamibacteria bacterium]
MLWILVLAIVFLLLTPVFLYLTGRRQEQQVEKEWELLLTQRGTKEIATATERVNSQLAVIDWAYDRAGAAQERGQTQQALDLFRIGCELIEDHCPTMLHCLGALAALSRMASAMAPSRPLRPSRFQLRELAHLALLNQFLHHLLVTTRERFRLRVAILVRGFRTLMRIVTASRTRIERSESEGVADIREALAARHDVRSLTDETLETFRLLILSLEAEEKQTRSP